MNNVFDFSIITNWIHKGVKLYMPDPVVVEDQSITTAGKHGLTGFTATGRGRRTSWWSAWHIMW